MVHSWVTSDSFQIVLSPNQSKAPGFSPLGESVCHSLSLRGSAAPQTDWLSTDHHTFSHRSPSILLLIPSLRLSLLISREVNKRVPTIPLSPLSSPVAVEAPPPWGTGPLPDHLCTTQKETIRNMLLLLWGAKRSNYRLYTACSVGQCQWLNDYYITACLHVLLLSHFTAPDVSEPLSESP